MELSGTDIRHYCGTDDIDVNDVTSFLRGAALKLRTDVRQCVSSTNAVIKEMAAAGEAEGAAVIADSQTGGRGRLGRSFFSPPGTGIYMSLLLRPNIPASDAVFITTAAAAAAAEAIEHISGKAAGIKWVNDIFSEGKKVCGILTEAALDASSGYLKYAVLGIGVNVYEPLGGFPNDIGAAGAVLSERQAGLRSRLAAEILNGFMEYYEHLTDRSFVSEYVRRSVVVGRDINVICAGKVRPAHAEGIDDECRLLVRYPDGSREALSSGEISIRVL